ncbi:MAG: adenosylcobalamin-dependent ribonucleoside-diphosphate reductase [Candidatus Hodarchaeota archaeon]
MIHKSGGGCIARGTRIYSTFCGVESIDTLYDYFSNRKEILAEENANILDISDENIQTFSFDKRTGEIIKKPVLKIWKYILDKKDTIKIVTEGNNEIISSNWHPFYVWKNNKVIEKRADEIQKGDYLITSNNSSIEKWPFYEYKSIQNFEIDEDFAYLIGLFQTDGSLRNFTNNKTGWKGLRLSFYSTDSVLLNSYQSILEKITGRKYSIQIDKRPLRKSKVVKYITSYDRKMNEVMKKLNRNIVGKKSKSVRIPELIFKSPISVISSYIAGLIDGDGHVTKSEKKLSFASGSEDFCIDLKCILSLFGIKPRYRVRKDKRLKNSVIFEITISSFEDYKTLANLILPYLKSIHKKQRIEKHIEMTHSSVSCPLDFIILQPILEKVGINTRSTKIWRKSVIVGEKSFFLARWKEKNLINRKKVIELITELVTSYRNQLSEKDKDYLKYLLRIIPSLIRVTSIEVGDVEEFYDFTVEETNNYLAGTGPLFVIHNTGFTFSHLRPANDKVQTTGGVASGPISFMTVFNSATEIIKQGGRRRGANMGILKVDHPDIMDFIHCKEDLKTLNNFNISVGLTEKFMEAVIQDEEYPLINPRNSQEVSRLKARVIFDEIVKMAYSNGEPGIVFLDRINETNPTPEIGDIEATNPCGEQPLLAYESCNLGSINLSKMAKKDSIDSLKFHVNYDRLERVVTLAVRFLDNVIDVSTFPLPEIERMTKANRKIGLGVMGFADLLIKLGIPYDSQKGIELAQRLMKYIYTIAIRESQKLAQERGSFPNFEKSILADKFPMMRNATLTTLAPTGSISIIAGCSSGIEPLFMLTYERRVLDDDILVEGYPFFVKIAKSQGFYSEELMEKIAATGSIAEIKEIPEEIRRIFVTAHDISPEWHVRMQAAFQTSGVDNAVSKTINFPKEATESDINNAYMLAYRLGCKGITVYRSGSRTYDVLSKKGTNDLKQMDEVLPSKKPRYRPDITRGVTERVRVGCGTNLFITINEDEEGLAELFLSLGKSGGCVASHIESMGRLISLALRSRIEPEEIILQLKSIRCPSPTFGSEGPILSCADAVAKSVERFINRYSINNHQNEVGFIEETEEDVSSSNSNSIYLSHTTSGLRPECPECGNLVEHSEGCVLCRVCGYSKCG